MRRILLLAVALSLVAGALAACQATPTPTPAPTPPPPLKAPEVHLMAVSLADTGPLVPDPDNLRKYAQAVPADPAAALKAFAGAPPFPVISTTIVVETRFEIHNPNPYPITIDRMDYRVQVDSQKMESIWTDQILFFKGASDAIWLPADGEVNISFANPVRFSTMLGERVLQRGLTVPAAIGDALKVWLGIQRGDLTFTVPGTAAVSSEQGSTTVSFNFTYKP